MTVPIHGEVTVSDNTTSLGKSSTKALEKSVISGILRDDVEFDATLPSRIADRLAVAIIEGRLAPGSRLSEPDLAEAFGTSRTPVREAIRILERDSLVELIPRRGARVSVIDAKRAADLYVCRAHLYGLAAKLACQNMTEDDLAECRSVLAEMDVAVNEEQSSQNYFRLNVSFHQRVTELADNAPLLLMVEQLGRPTLRLRFLSLSTPGRMEASLKAHGELVKSFESGDDLEAEQIVRRVIRDAAVAIQRHHFENEELAEHLERVI